MKFQTLASAMTLMILVQGCGRIESGIVDYEGIKIIDLPMNIELKTSVYDELLRSCTETKKFDALIAKANDRVSDFPENFVLVSFYPKRESMDEAYVYTATCEDSLCVATNYWIGGETERRTENFLRSEMRLLFDKEFESPDYEPNDSIHNRCYVLIHDSKRDRAVVYSDEVSRAGESLEMLDFLFSGDWEQLYEVSTPEQ